MSSRHKDGGETRGKQDVFKVSYFYFSLCTESAESSQIKKEKQLGEGCKSEPMDTSSSFVSSSGATAEDKKPEIKKEPEEEGSGSAASSSSPVSAQSKKKSKSLTATLDLMKRTTAGEHEKSPSLFVSSHCIFSQSSSQRSCVRL